MGNLQTVRFRPPSLGLDTDAARNAIAETRAALLENFQTGTTGVIRQRGPLALGTASPANPVEMLQSMIVKGSSALIQRTTTNACYYALGASTVTNFAPGFVTYPRGTSAEVGAYAYAVNANGTANQEVLRWNGTTTLVQLANAPYHAAGVATHLGRLWAAGGTVPGAGAGTTQYPTSLFWTDIGGPTADTLVQWEDDVSGLVNQIELDSNLGDPIVALAKVGRNLAIIRQSSVWLLTGDTPATFAAHRVVGGLGGLAFTPVIELDDAVLFFSSQGLAIFDGASAVPITGGVGRALTAACAVEQDQTYPLLGLARLSPTHIMVSLRNNGFAAILELATMSWSTFHSSNMGPTTPNHVCSVGSGAVAWDGEAVWTLRRTNGRSIVLPESVLATNTLGFDTTQGIRSRYHSRVAELVAPTQKAQLHRAMIEYDFRGSAVVNPTSYGLKLSLYDSQGTVLLAATDLPVGTGLQRQQIDVFTETSDVQARIEYLIPNATPTNVTKLEVYDVWVEYQATRQR